MRHELLDLVYKPEDLNFEYYNKIKDLGDVELEHQIGRLTNFKKLLGEIFLNDTKGDIIEFGTWKGFSLLWIAYLCERIGIFDKKIIGIDGFIGLPDAEGPFQKGAFKNTSLKECWRNIFYNKYLYDITKKNVFIERFLYSQKENIIKRLRHLGVSKFSFVHIDCDLSSSVKEIFDILIEGNFLNEECYILFDDYGCDSNLGATVDSILLNMQKEYEIKEHSSTKLTKNFKLRRKFYEINK